MSRECVEKLIELYQLGKACKKQKVSAESAHRILFDSVVFDKWDEQLVVTVPKIKAFFQLTPKKMDDVLERLVLDADDVENATKDIIDFERHIEAATIDDVEVDQVRHRPTKLALTLSMQKILKFQKLLHIARYELLRFAHTFWYFNTIINFELANQATGCLNSGEQIQIVLIELMAIHLQI